ncbi:MAG TPA: hypothetical protein VLX61_06680 [Anaerolineales bacterium]|nr:hypothetical protein [Anaerolineales bacterium]
MFENKGQYLLMTPSEGYSVESYKKAIAEARDLCEQYGLTKMLADVRRLDYPISAADRFEIGVEIANTFGAKIQFAILAPAAMINGLVENAAVNRGGNVRAFSNMEEAKEWLGVK